MGDPRYPLDWGRISRCLKNRTAFTCESCGAKDDWESGSGTTVHHLDRNKENPSSWSEFFPLLQRDGHHPNLIVLCQRCHLRAEHWALAGEVLSRQDCLDRLLYIRTEERRQRSLPL